MNIHVWTGFWVDVSPPPHPVIAGSYGKYMFSFLKETANYFPGMLYYFTFPTAMHESQFPPSLPPFSLYLFW